MKLSGIYEYKCTNCGEKLGLYIHQRLKPGNKSPGVLTVLCESCHTELHKTGKVKRGNPTGRRGKKAPVICSVDSCERLQHGRGLCKKHYENARRKKLFDYDF